MLASKRSLTARVPAVMSLVSFVALVWLAALALPPAAAAQSEAPAQAAPAEPALPDAPPPAPAAGTAVVEGVPSAPGATTVADAPPSVSDAPPSAGDGQPGEQPPPPSFPQGDAPPPAPSFPQGDDGDAVTQTDIDAFDEEEEAPMPPPEPLGMFGFSFGAGFSFGGDELVGASFSNGDSAEIKAGQGAFLSLGLDLTPVRVGAHAFGVGVDQSVKFASIDATNASIDLVRFPLVVTAHYDLTLTDTWHFVAAGGMVYEYGIHLGGTGDASNLDVDIDPAVGWLAEGGVAYVEGSVVVDITLRYIGLEYQNPVQALSDVDASSVGLSVAGHYYF